MRSILAQLPALNALLNGISAVLVALGYVAVRRGRRETHRRFMFAATATSGLFLVSYVIKTWLHGTTVYGGTGWLRTLYLTILFSHLTLAIAVVPLVAVTLLSGLRERFRQHRAIARWTLPIWFYVSVTGVVVYFMLRPWYPAA